MALAISFRLSVANVESLRVPLDCFFPEDRDRPLTFGVGELFEDAVFLLSYRAIE